MSEIQSGKFSMNSSSSKIAIVLGILFIIGSIILAILPFKEGNPEMIFGSYKLLQALGAGSIASVFFNKINVGNDSQQLIITAGGGAAIFLLIYFFGPEANMFAKMVS